VAAGTTSQPSDPQPQRWLAPLVAVVVFAVPYLLFDRLILYQFYLRGSFLLDSGLLAGLIWHDAATFSLPPSLGGENFFAFHAAPLLWLLSAASELFPVSMAQWFAGFIGVCHGLLALAIFWLLVAGFGMRRGALLALAAATAVAFACNGLALAIARYPHFETFGAAGLLFCCVALVLGWPKIAAVALLVALTTREDIGLHAFAFLSVWAVANRLAGLPWRHSAWILGLALAGALASVAALVAQHLAFPGHSSFVRVYLGDPPYAHLTANLLLVRLGGWLMVHGANILLPAIAALVWAARTRNPFVLAGYLACLPWALLHVLAASELAGWMVGYYAYPFLIAMAWPLLAVAIRRQQIAVPPTPAWAPATGLLALVALSLLPVGHDYDPGRITLPDAFWRAPSTAQQAATDRAIATIAAARPLLGRLEVDNSVAALAPFAFGRAEVATWAEGTPDTAVRFADGFDAAKLRALPGLPRRYRVIGTELRLATNRADAVMRSLDIPLLPDP